MLERFLNWLGINNEEEELSSTRVSIPDDWTFEAMPLANLSVSDTGPEIYTTSQASNSMRLRSTNTKRGIRVGDKIKYRVFWSTHNIETASGVVRKIITLEGDFYGVILEGGVGVRAGDIVEHTPGRNDLFREDA